MGWDLKILKSEDSMSDRRKLSKVDINTRLLKFIQETEV